MSTLRQELLLLRKAIGTRSGLDEEHLSELLTEQDPREAYKQALRQWRPPIPGLPGRSPLPLGLGVSATTPLNERRRRASEPFHDLMLATEIIRDKVLIRYMIGLGNIVFALWIVTMLLIIA